MWMNLRNIMLSEINQTCNRTFHMIPFILTPKLDKTALWWQKSEWCSLRVGLRSVRRVIVVLDWNGHKEAFRDDSTVPYLDTSTYHMSMYLYQNQVSWIFKVCLIPWCINYISNFGTIRWTHSWFTFIPHLPPLSLNHFKWKLGQNFLFFLSLIHPLPVIP